VSASAYFVDEKCSQHGSDGAESKVRGKYCFAMLKKKSGSSSLKSSEALTLLKWDLKSLSGRVFVFLPSS